MPCYTIIIYLTQTNHHLIQNDGHYHYIPQITGLYMAKSSWDRSEQFNGTKPVGWTFLLNYPPLLSKFFFHRHMSSLHIQCHSLPPYPLQHCKVASLLRLSSLSLFLPLLPFPFNRSIHPNSV